MTPLMKKIQGLQALHGATPHTLEKQPSTLEVEISAPKPTIIGA